MDPFPGHADPGVFRVYIISNSEYISGRFVIPVYAFDILFHICIQATFLLPRLTTIFYT